MERVGAAGLPALVGQDAAQRALSHPSAGSVLILGPDGVGRFRLALGAARAILGVDGPSAARVDSLQHVDLGVLDPDEGIDGVRAAAERLSRRPAEGARQVLILRDLDRMSHEAHNALLKTLEEPPADAAILALAESTMHLPETVVSRCRVVRARPLTDAETARVLEQLGHPPDRAAALAADAEGSPGRALYLGEHEVPAAAAALRRVLAGGEADPLGAVDPILRRRPDEKSGDQRRRLEEVLRVAASHLRRELPRSERPLRSVLAALGSMGAHANPAIVFSDLALFSFLESSGRPSPASRSSREG